jgi:hypothetical protein
MHYLIDKEEINDISIHFPITNLGKNLISMQVSSYKVYFHGN